MVKDMQQNSIYGANCCINAMRLLMWVFSAALSAVNADELLKCVYPGCSPLAPTTKGVIKS
jgi:hypothetical protein